MTSKRIYFLRGLFRLAIAVALAGLALLAFNVIGYLSVSYDFVFIGDLSNFKRLDSYAGRALLLAFIGFVQTAFVAIAAVFSCVLLVGGYHAILRIGGYRKDAAF